MPPKKKRKPAATLSQRELAREYGFGWRFFKSDPELWKLLKEAVSESWTPERFEAKFKATKWYKKHSDIYRSNLALKFNDPATYRERLFNTQTVVRNLGKMWGAQLTDREVRRYSQRAFLLGWNEAQIMDALAKEVTPDRNGQFGGQLAGIQQRLKQVAFGNGVNLGDKQIQNWMRRIVRGEADVAQFESYVRGVAAKTFSAYGEQIMAGVDAIDLASPYIQAMADVLEMNPNAISLTDRTLRRAMSYVDPATGKASAMSVADFEDSLRADPRWQYTDQAHEQLQGYAVELGKMWGVLS